MTAAAAPGRSRRGLDAVQAVPPVLLRQLSTLIAFAVAVLVVVAAPGTHLSHAPSVLAGVGIEVLATLVALALGRRPPDPARATDDPVAVVVPVLSVLAIGFLRLGTGGAASLFTPMLVLPVVWIASEPGRRYVLLAAVSTSAALALPSLLGRTDGDGARGPWRAVFGPFVYALAALTINEIARRVRAAVVTLKASEVRLRAADRLTRSVLDAVTEQAVIGTDRAGLIDVWNPGAAAMLGLPPAEAQGHRTVLDFVAAEDLVARRGRDTFDALVEPVRPGHAEVREWTWVRADGSRLPVLVAATARQDETDQVVGYIFVADDQTQAHEASRVKDEFVGTVSHELRTPVSAVLGHLELLRDDPLTDDQRQYIAVAERNAHRLLRLVNDLLFTAQVDSGGLPLTLVDVDLAEVVAAAAQSAAPAAARAGIDLVVDAPSSAPHVRGDAGRLGQAVDNLLSNAIKFTPRDGRVTVALSGTDEEVVLSVRDTGMGVPADELDRLFGRFFRSSTAVRSAVPGIGLGLTITRAIVTAHRGIMEVTSTEGTGTTFVVRLPVPGAADDPDDDPGAAASDPAQPSGSSPPSGPDRAARTEASPGETLRSSPAPPGWSAG
ncbi:MAG TPA: ATP-binding protein [Cellulomonas sp.]